MCEFLNLTFSKPFSLLGACNVAKPRKSKLYDRHVSIKNGQGRLSETEDRWQSSREALYLLVWSLYWSISQVHILISESFSKRAPVLWNEIV